MKKLLTLIIALMMVLSLAACSDKKTEETVNDSEDKVQVGTEAEKNEDVVEDEVAEEDEEIEEVASEDEKEETPSEDKKPTENSKPSEDKKPVENSKPSEDKKPAENNKPSEDKKPTQEDKPAVPAPETTPETKPETNTDKTVGNTLLSEFKSVAGSAGALGVAEKLAANSAVSELGLVSMEVEPGFLTGFDNTEITGFKEGAVFSPMIGTIPFVGYVFTLEDGVNASDFISTLKSSANLRWNICTTAEEMVAGSSGNKVFFVMCNKSFE